MTAGPAGGTYQCALVWKASTPGQVDLASQVSARGCARMSAGPPDQLSISISISIRMGRLGCGGCGGGLPPAGADVSVDARTLWVYSEMSANRRILYQ